MTVAVVRSPAAVVQLLAVKWWQQLGKFARCIDLLLRLVAASISSGSYVQQLAVERSCYAIALNRSGESCIKIGSGGPKAA